MDINTYTHKHKLTYKGTSYANTPDGNTHSHSTSVFQQCFHVKLTTCSECSETSTHVVHPNREEQTRSIAKVPALVERHLCRRCRSDEPHEHGPHGDPPRHGHPPLEVVPKFTSGGATPNCTLPSILYLTGRTLKLKNCTRQWTLIGVDTPAYCAQGYMRVPTVRLAVHVAPFFCLTSHVHVTLRLFALA